MNNVKSKNSQKRVVIGRSARLSTLALSLVLTQIIFAQTAQKTPAQKSTTQQNVDFDLMNSIDNQLLPILIPQQDQSKTGYLRYNFTFDNYNGFYVTRRADASANPAKGILVAVRETGTLKKNDNPHGSEVAYYRNDQKPWCIHVTSYNADFTYLVKTQTMKTNKTRQLKNLYDIVNVGAKKDALTNPSTQENGLNQRGENMTAIYNNGNFIVTQGEGNHNGSIVVDFKDATTQEIKGNVVNLANYTGSSKQKYAKGWGENNITFGQNTTGKILGTIITTGVGLNKITFKNGGEVQNGIYNTGTESTAINDIEFSANSSKLSGDVVNTGVGLNKITFKNGGEIASNFRNSSTGANVIIAGNANYDEKSDPKSNLPAYVKAIKPDLVILTSQNAPKLAFKHAAAQKDTFTQTQKRHETERAKKESKDKKRIKEDYEKIKLNFEDQKILAQIKFDNQGGAAPIEAQNNATYYVNAITNKATNYDDFKEQNLGQVLIKASGGAKVIIPDRIEGYDGSRLLIQKSTQSNQNQSGGQSEVSYITAGAKDFLTDATVNSIISSHISALDPIFASLDTQTKRLNNYVDESDYLASDIIDPSDEGESQSQNEEDTKATAKKPIIKVPKHRIYANAAFGALKNDLIKNKASANKISKSTNYQTLDFGYDYKIKSKYRSFFGISAGLISAQSTYDLSANQNYISLEYEGAKARSQMVLTLAHIIWSAKKLLQIRR
ncbi:MAG: hypothetical protein E7K04_05735 [Helicobacter sp.]|nr:hypothetical protein [Helicobacter sp.]